MGFVHMNTCKVAAFKWHAAVIWLKYYRYGVKHYIFNQSIIKWHAFSFVGQSDKNHEMKSEAALILFVLVSTVHLSQQQFPLLSSLVRRWELSIDPTWPAAGQKLTSSAQVYRLNLFTSPPSLSFSDNDFFYCFIGHFEIIS